MNRKTTSFAALMFIAFLFFACNNQSKQTNKDTEHNNNTTFYKAGSYQTIVCAEDTKESYTAYFPNAYNPNEKLPVIIVFDAHARGKLAAQKFQKAADNFGYLIVASNNAKNGSKTIGHTVNVLFKDVLSRFKIDTKQIYTAGFSGGAKIATSIAVQQGGIAGVISIAAGLPQAGQQISNYFNFASIVGINDFNYLELNELDKQIGTLGFAHNLFITDKGHEWPNDSTINSAVEWMQILAIKKGIVPSDDHMIRNYIDHVSIHINKLILEDKVYRAKQEYEVFLSSLKNLIDISEYEKSYRTLLKNPNIKTQQSEFKKIAEQEGSKQQAYLNYFKNGQFNKIAQEIELQRKNILTKDFAQKHSAQRLINYISMLSYLFTDSYIKQNNLQAAENVLKIYKLADKNNPDVYFFEASIYDKKAMDKKAISSLQKAVSLGFSDVDRLYNTQYFNRISTLAEFDLIIQKAKKNFDNE